jgi:hypothetical protein
VMMRSESTSALGQPRDTNEIRGARFIERFMGRYITPRPAFRHENARWPSRYGLSEPAIRDRIGNWLRIFAGN